MREPEPDLMLVESQALTSNGVAVRLDDGTSAPMRDSSDLLGDRQALRRRYREDGYLYLRRYLDPTPVVRLRSDYFARFDPSYLRAGTSPADGVFSGRRPAGLPAHGVPGHPAHAFVRDPAFQRFASSPQLLDLAATVLDGPVVALPRQIVRHFDRWEAIASRAHADHPYLSDGSEQVTTVWIPIGDCPRRTGSLLYLEGSHKVDPDRFEPLRVVSDRPEDRRAISHDLSWVASSLGLRWRWADYTAGDVTIHGPRIVHASLDTTTDAMRLSADLRFLRAGEAADPRWLVPWSGDDGN